VGTGKGERRRGSVFWPSRDVLPRAILIDLLRLSLVAAPVAFFEIQYLKTPQVFLEGLHELEQTD